jgi:hypothetical protein
MLSVCADSYRDCVCVVGFLVGGSAVWKLLSGGVAIRGG